MTHFHVDVQEADGKKRVGALATTLEAAKQEAQIEEESEPRRLVTLRQCTLECFGKRLSAA